MTTLTTAVLAAAFDDATDAAVLAARDLVIRVGVPLPARPRHRPHVTVAAVRIHRDRIDALADLVRDAVDGTDPFSCRFGRVGTFGRAGALWLGPDDGSAALCTLQQSVHGAVTAGPWPAAFAGRTAPAGWVPHCSLATRLDARTLARAETAVRDAFTPVDAVCAGVAIVLVGGAGDLATVPLGDGRPSAWPAA